jgi:hypothetical protein
MAINNFSSLGETVDVINEAYFLGEAMPKSERLKAGSWIAQQQGQPGAYARMFAPTGLDFKNHVRVFTGEHITSRVGTSHILGQEASRALILLGAKTPMINKALALATQGIHQRLIDSVEKGYPLGMYCCGICTCSLWRHLAAGGIRKARPKQWLQAGMKQLKAHRIGHGSWRRFPFFYTLSALAEIKLPSALVEMKYAAPACERYLKHLAKKDKYSQRRRILAQRILVKC